MEHQLTVHQASIYVHESGSGVPLLMLHGSPDTHAMWLPLAALLNDHARCFALDLPGFGRSTLPAAFSLSLDHMADFVADLLVALGIGEPVNLLSADFGVHYALAFLVKYPDRVRGIALSNSVFDRTYQWHSFARLYRLPLVGEIIMATTTKAAIAAAMKGFAPALPNDYIEQSYASGFGSPSVKRAILRMYRERQPQDFAGWDERSRGFMQTKPSLVLWGDKDPFAAATFAETFGAQAVHHFATYSHWLPLEATTVYAERLIPWLHQTAAR